MEILKGIIIFIITYCSIMLPLRIIEAMGLIKKEIHVAWVVLTICLAVVTLSLIK